MDFRRVGVCGQNLLKETPGATWMTIVIIRIMVINDHKDEHPHFYDDHLNEIIPNLEILEAVLFRCG